MSPLGDDSLCGIAAGHSMEVRMRLDYRQHLITAKPVGNVCNMNCRYCHNHENRNTLIKTEVMSDKVLEECIKQNYYMHEKKTAVRFKWSGGEPTLCGMDFFEKVVKLQQQYGKGQQTLNIIVTNGLLLDEEWCEFLAQKRFIVAISLDGPRSCHDAFRIDEQGQGTFDRVMKAISLMKIFKVQFYAIAAINSVNIQKPLEFYAFMKAVSCRLHFLPVMERDGIKDCSVTAEAFGNFICEILVDWFKNDDGKVTIQMFECALLNLGRRPATMCIHEETCGHCGMLDTNGDVYSCQEYADESYRLGNILEEDLSVIMAKNKDFGLSKLIDLPAKCMRCSQIKMCYGGCMRDRFTLEENASEAGVNRMCVGYKRFFEVFAETMRIYVYNDMNFFRD